MTDFDPSPESSPSAIPDCPKCGGEMWDNREGKRNPKAPDFKCKDRGCDGVIWPPRTASAGAAPFAGASATSGASSAGSAGAVASGAPSCPICGGPMWDDRASKRNPKAPDFKCKNKPKVRGGPGCEGVIWPPRDGKSSIMPQGARPASSSGGGAAGTATRPRPSAPPAYGESPPPYDGPPPDDDDLPF